jgi:hypothetical protein
MRRPTATRNEAAEYAAYITGFVVTCIGLAVLINVLIEPLVPHILKAV